MRRAQRPLIWLILVVGGSAGALPLALASASVARWIAPVGPSGWVAPAVTAAVVGLDAIHRRTSWMRPVAVNRQVPRHWGHEHGPWWATARYAPRLGIGPATILTSWAWWGMFVCGAVAGWRWAVGAGLVFVGVRASTTVLAGAGIGDGRAMAQRLSSIASLEHHVTLATSVVLVSALILGALG